MLFLNRGTASRMASLDKPAVPTLEGPGQANTSMQSRNNAPAQDEDFAVTSYCEPCNNPEAGDYTCQKYPSKVPGDFDVWQCGKVTGEPTNHVILLTSPIEYRTAEPFKEACTLASTLQCVVYLIQYRLPQEYSDLDSSSSEEAVKRSLVSLSKVHSAFDKNIANDMALLAVPTVLK
ncbi:hypothetical protein PSACC_01163 [Paramicrosporidium saccamoebae]|uniref:Uncharacterized protein n=1 Tax=Paramicrosporidium saccamoebae TaxID=1246581 RepID=A0A2H9TMQ0_9FUNG|nr:hypothetical protein PSACC_01163 [Paramicrosporidium saccamoebae]